MQLDKSVITNAGIALLNSCIADKKALQFVKIATGSGKYTNSDSLEELTNLKNTEQTESDFLITKNKDLAVVRFSLGNEGVQEGYRLREIGVFAKEEGGSATPVLYSISVVYDDEKADFISSFSSGKMPSALEFNLYYKISKDVNVNITPEDIFCVSPVYFQFLSNIFTVKVLPNFILGILNHFFCFSSIKATSISSSLSISST